MVKVGCCGFPVKRREYEGRFNLVEVQQTFYQPPRPETLKRWRQEAPPDFEFTLKAWQLITHEPSSPTYRRLQRPLTPEERRQTGSFRDTPLVRQAWETTREAARSLGAGIILFQCPARFGPTGDNQERLRRFFRALSRNEFRFAWEPRGDWPREQVAELCRELHLLPALDPFKTAPFPDSPGYFRLHGRGGYRYVYADADLEALADLVAVHPEAYVLFNNMSMWQDAGRFLELLAKR
jgi:uncharacterized protein YecE (DUF72 family)